MHLEGRDAAAANVDDLQDALEDVVTVKSSGCTVFPLSVNVRHGKKGKRHGLRSEAASGSRSGFGVTSDKKKSGADEKQSSRVLYRLQC